MSWPRSTARTSSTTGQANYAYEAKRKDLEDKFSTALSQMRERYLQEVLSTHQGEAA